MAHSIQDYLRKINSSLSYADCLAVAVTALFTGALAIYFIYEGEEAKLPVVYRSAGTVLGDSADSRPFGSRKGTTYTYSWCSGSGQIKEANKVYFKDADAAEASGRTFSKLCNK
jgi:hypothetical protein